MFVRAQGTIRPHRRTANYEATHKDLSRSKFKNKIATIDGIKFRSQAEARRYQQLKLLERAGEISHLKLQPRYPLEVNGKKICTYVADYEYFDWRTESIVTEDVKGARTLLYTVKKKLFEACYGRPVTEVRA